MNLALILFGVWPYLALAIFVVGHIWRWRQDQFGWTSRTSQLMEKRWLMIGSPILHIGILLAVAGHAMGLLIPASLTEALGISEHTYHMTAVVGGILAAILVVVGFTILMIRRFMTKARLRIVTRRADVVMYIIFAITAAVGCVTTLSNAIGGGYDYRSTVSIWFRSVFTFQPAVESMAAAPAVYQVHAACAFALVAIWPFTRLVHVWSVPLGYLLRPLIVYRTAAVRR